MSQKTVLILTQALLLLARLAASWTPSPVARYPVKYDPNRAPFGNGNVTNYFKVLDQDDYSILVGAR